LRNSFRDTRRSKFTINGRRGWERQRYGAEDESVVYHSRAEEFIGASRRELRAAVKKVQVSVG
jgi:hypothetical protein